MTGTLPSAEVFIATSLDGFIARPDGDIEWLVGRPTPEGEDFGYAAFMDGIGALVMGRQSFDKVVNYPEWPYPVPVIVLSRSPGAVKVPEALREQVRVISAAPADLLRGSGRTGRSAGLRRRRPGRARLPG
jgi:dihydrofolate reductase